MPRLQTGVGVVVQEAGTTSAGTTYVVSIASRPIIANWQGVFGLTRGDHVIVHKMDVAKQGNIIGLAFGDDVEGRPGGATPSSGSVGGPNIGTGGDPGEVGIHTSGSLTFNVLADQKYGFGPVVVPFASSALWMRIYGQNSTPGTVQIRGAVYHNSGGSIGTIGGIPGSLVGTTEVITIAGSQAANWYIAAFSPTITVQSGQYHLLAQVGGTTFKAGYGTAPPYNRWGPTNDTFSDGPSNPAGNMGTTIRQYAAITLNMEYLPSASVGGGFFQFDIGPGLDLSHLDDG